MATAITKTQCSICEKEKGTYNCRGCSKDFCFNHLNEHRQTLSEHFNEIENDRNQLQQALIEYKNNQKPHFLIEQINRWEEDSINQIKQTAEQSRQIFYNYMNNNIIEIDIKLTKLTQQLRHIHQEKEYNEIDLN